MRVKPLLLNGIKREMLLPIIKKDAGGRLVRRIELVCVDE